MTPDLYFIAEFACIHEGDREYLLDLARACREAGADAVKFQIFDPKEIVADDHPDYDYFNQIAFSAPQWHDIITECAALGLGVWVDASGRFSLDVVEASKEFVVGVKIHSADIDNAVVLAGVKDLAIPIAAGCGGTSLIDLFELLDSLPPEREIVLMHGYQPFPKLDGAKGGPPATGQTAADLNLWRIRQLAETFPQARIGISEHLAGDDPFATEVAALAVAFGASVIEKHVTLVRDEKREDYYSAIEPPAFRRMVDVARRTSVAVGADQREMGHGERGYQREMKRSAKAAADLASGTALDGSVIKPVRDGRYESSARFRRLVGQTLCKSVAAGETVASAAIAQKVGVFCNARVGSRRLPRKALLPFFGEHTTLGYLLKRLTSYPGDIGEIALATTELKEDDVLEELAKRMNIPCVRGADDDIMGRMLQTADAFGWDTVVRVTGDDQFVSCEYIEKAVQHHLANSLDFTQISKLPIGMACEVIDVHTLRRIHQAVAHRGDTEYLTWFLDSDWVCRNGTLEADPEHRYERLRVTLDYPADYELMRELAKQCHAGCKDFYIPIDGLLQILKRIDPGLRGDIPTPLRRDQIDTRLRYEHRIDEYDSKGGLDHVPADRERELVEAT